MKCPLLQVAWQINNRTESHEVFDCLKEKRAWWRADHEECAMLGLSYQLEALACALVTVQDKMPHEEQFRR